MCQVTFSIRMDEGLKNEFGGLCDDFGISMAAAINMFAKTVVRERRIPFEISAEPSKDASLKSFLKIRGLMKERFPDGMTLDEINEEISAARSSRE